MTQRTSESMNESINAWMISQFDELAKQWRNQWVADSVNQWTNESMNQGNKERKYGWMNELMEPFHRGFVEGRFQIIREKSSKKYPADHAVILALGEADFFNREFHWWWIMIHPFLGHFIPEGADGIQSMTGLQEIRRWTLEPTSGQPATATGLAAKSVARRIPKAFSAWNIGHPDKQLDATSKRGV